MFSNTIKYFSHATRHTLLDRVKGYLDKSNSIEVHRQLLMKKYGLDELYAFDIGENPNGYSPKVRDYLHILNDENGESLHLEHYPEITHNCLKQRIARHFDVHEDWILISSGLDSIIDLITKVFYDPGDNYLLPVPTFYLFEEYAERMRARPVYFKVGENSRLVWTPSLVQRFEEILSQVKPKNIWLTNPNNPSGQTIPKEILHELIDLAYRNHCFVVVDEAYGEYMDDLEQDSASRFLHQFPNLMVLRTFSKAYGLAGIRLGYLMCSSTDVIDALMVHRYYFPAPQMCLQIAQIAIEDHAYIRQTRSSARKHTSEMYKAFDQMESFEYIPSLSHVFMLKNKYLKASELYELLLERGFVVTNLTISGLEDDSYVRVAGRDTDDNLLFLRACREIDVLVTH